jgi:alpha-galactosidase
MAVLPAGASEKIVPHREGIRDSVATKSLCKTLDFAFPSNNLESMIQIKFTGDFGFPQHGPGVDMRNSTSINRFKLISQEEKGNSFCSIFESDDKMKIVHTLIRPENCNFLECSTEFINGSETSRRVEMFTSFSMGMISLLHSDDAPKALKLHRYPSFWSSETKHLEQTFEELNMEISWQSAGVRSQRFGQRSSMVNKEYQPFAAVEDTKHGIIWAAALEAVSPWEMMVSRYCDFR